MQKKKIDNLSFKNNQCENLIWKNQNTVALLGTGKKV